MVKETEYYLHQTPVDLCKDIISSIHFPDGISVLEPYAGENSFYDNLPNNCIKCRTEIEDGLDYRDFDFEQTKIDIVISNPPFRIDGKNCYFDLLLFFSKKDIDTIIFLSNDYCYNSITPKRMKKINETGMYLNKVTMTNVFKWRGRYLLSEFRRTKNPSFEYFNKIYK